jgi:hypothetical protein
VRPIVCGMPPGPPEPPPAGTVDQTPDDEARAEARSAGHRGEGLTSLPGYEALSELGRDGTHTAPEAGVPGTRKKSESVGGSAPVSHTG